MNQDTTQATDLVEQTLDILCPQAPVGISALQADGRMSWKYFKSHKDGAAWATELPQTVKATYVVLNPYAKVSEGPGVTKRDITRRAWLLIDCDPKREKRSNASEWELGLARSVTAKIKSYLSSAGCPDPLEGDSGNGAHLLYPIDLPNDDASTALINGVLKHLECFNTQGVAVDQTTGDASQISKLYGTVARKGPPTEDRPHRCSALTSIPDHLTAVPVATLQRLAGVTAKASTRVPLSSIGQGYDLDAILDKVRIFSQTDKGDYTEYQIRCPWDECHSDPGSNHGTIFTWSTDGAPGFTCPHDSCTKAGRRWNAFRDHLGLKPMACPLTEAGDAEYFAVRHAGRVSYDARRKRWLLIEDESGLWLPDPVERLRGYAVETMRGRQADAAKIDDLERRKQAWQWAIKGECTARLNNLLREARVQPEIRNDSHVDPWDADPSLLGVPGGVVDLRTGEKRKALPDERITMSSGAEYDPAARSELWEQTLRAISEEDDAWVDYLQRLGGYTITGDTSQDKWFIKHGRLGRNGKGTIDGAWTGALGDYVLELPSAVFELRPRGNPDFDLSYLPNKRFVLSSESGNTVHLHHDRIKQMTGGGSMRVANKHEKSFEFEPACKLWLACNDLPTVTDDSAAFWARVIVIPFRCSFYGKEDTTLRPLLHLDPAHRRAVLAWLVRGAVDYYRHGLGEMPPSVRVATNAFRDVSWALTPLINEDCIVGPTARVSVGKFNSAYQRFCERQGVPKDKRLGWKRVLKLMEARYDTVGVQEKVDGRRVQEKRYVGVALREPIAEPEEPPL